MIARDLISDSLIPLKTSDSGAHALSVMDEYRVSHLPIVNNTSFLGMISDTDIFNMNTVDDPLGNFALSLSGAYVKENQPIYDVIQTFANMKLTLIPVLDDKDSYLGVITLANLVHHLAGITSSILREVSLFWKSTIRITRWRNFPRLWKQTKPKY